MQFEWSEKKNAINIRQHGVAFRNVLGVFSDPEMRLEESHADPITGEPRWIAIGRPSADSSIDYLVVHVYRGENEEIIRIISARKGSKGES